jgi:ribonuclease HI
MNRRARFISTAKRTGKQVKSRFCASLLGWHLADETRPATDPPTSRRFNEMLIDNALNIYTDGSSYSGPRVGGVGFRFVTADEFGEEVVEDFVVPGFKGATNNQMELQACVEALKEATKYHDLTPFDKIAIHTDSRYIVDNYKRAIFEWSGNKWRNRDNRPILNADRWKELLRLMWKCAPRRVDFYWVKAHSKDPHNRAVDKLAKGSAKNALNEPLTIVNVRRKTTSTSEERGSVEMRGQRFSIRVITDEYLKTQRMNKYKYQVISKGSRYFGSVDTIFSVELLKAGHHYEVRVNKKTANPTIVKVLRELER